MKKIKKCGFVLIVCLVSVIIVGVYFINQNWTIRYASVFDGFFGKGNWKCIDEEKKDSLIYDEYEINNIYPELSENVPGKFHNWYILYDDGQNESIWHITDHVYKINNDKCSIINHNRLSAKQALTMELMDISFDVIGDNIKSDIIEEYLPQAESDCIEVGISYEGGNPKPEFYDKLLKESWFKCNEVSAERYLSMDTADFYIDIKAYDYRIKKLSDTEKDHLMNSLETIEQGLRDKYGEHASYKIYFDDFHQAEHKAQ